MPSLGCFDAEASVSETLNDAGKAARRLGVDEYEISVSTSEDRKVTLTPNDSRSVSAMSKRSLCVRVIRKRRMGVAFSNNFGSKQLTSCLRSALKLTRHRPEDPQLKSFAARESPRSMVPNMANAGIARLDFSDENDKMDTMLASANDCEGDVRVIGGSIIASLGAAGVANSNGVVISEERTLLYADCLSVSGTGRSVSPECISTMTTRKAKLPFEKIGADCATIASHCSNRISPKTEECDVVFSAQALGMSEGGLLTAILTPALSGMEVVNESTLFANRLGEKVASSRFSMRDDPTLPGRAGSRSFDDEGVRTKSKWLIRNGLLKQFVWDNHYGSIANRSSTGNAVRDPSTGMVSPLPLNITVKGDKGDMDALVSDVDHGYLIWGCQGAHTSNPQTGDYSFVASPGLMIEGGEIVGGVQGAMVSGNVIDLLSSLEAIGSDITDFGSSLMPSMTFRDVKITTG